MSFVGKLLGKVTGADAAAKGAEQAAATQAQSAQLGINEQQRQFDAFQAALAPYMQAGAPALAGQQNLIGLNGAGAQQTAIDGIANGPQYTALAQQGENAILQNASATGGLRGGNAQAALGQFRPQLLNQLIEQQYARLGGLTSLGQSSAAGVGNAGMQTGSNIAGLLQQQGAATAGGQLARGGVAQQGFNTAAQIAAMAFGAGGFGGGPAAAAGSGTVTNTLF